MGFNIQTRLAWAEFMRRLESSDPTHRIAVPSFLEQVDTLADNLKGESFDQLLKCPVLPQVMTMWREFLNHRQNNGELSAFWISYMDTAEGIVLGLLQAFREGDMVSYSRYLTPYSLLLKYRKHSRKAVFPFR